MKPFILASLGLHLLVLDMATVHAHLTGASAGRYLPLEWISRRFGGWQLFAWIVGGIVVLTLATRALTGWFRLAMDKVNPPGWMFIFLSAVAGIVTAGAWWFLKEWNGFWR